MALYTRYTPHTQKYYKYIALYESIMINVQYVSHVMIGQARLPGHCIEMGLNGSQWLQPLFLAIETYVKR